MEAFSWLSLLYGSQFLLKAAMASRHSAAPMQLLPGREKSVTIVQAILSGDRTLATTLEANLATVGAAAFVWLVDNDDKEAQAIAGQLMAVHPAVDLQVVVCPPPPDGINPKVFKLELALPLVQREVVVVVDDDTRISRSGLAALIDGLDGGATIATGLPCYVPSSGWPSQMLAEFVNDSAINVYLPVAWMGEPFALNGMCFAMRTHEVVRLDIPKMIGPCIVDDLALAELVLRSGGRIRQTAQPHFITTHVDSWRHLGLLLHRWFVFARLLIDAQPTRRRAGVIIAYGLPPLLLWTLCLSINTWIEVYLLSCLLLLRSLTLGFLQRKFYGCVRHNPLTSILLELGQPCFLILSYFKKSIQWRRRRIMIRHLRDFTYQ